MHVHTTNRIGVTPLKKLIALLLILAMSLLSGCGYLVVEERTFAGSAALAEEAKETAPPAPTPGATPVPEVGEQSWYIKA